MKFKQNFNRNMVVPATRPNMNYIVAIRIKKRLINTDQWTVFYFRY